MSTPSSSFSASSSSPSSTVTTTTTTSSSPSTAAHTSNAATVTLQMMKDDNTIVTLPFGSCIVDIFGGAPETVPPVDIQVKLEYDPTNTGKYTTGASLVSCTLRHRRAASSTDTTDTKSSSSSSHDGWYNTVLQHSAICPTRYLNIRHPSIPYQPRVGASIRFAVCVIVQCRTRGYLITRRASHMRAFPGAYVFPGGRVDRGESAEDAAYREVYEETGLRLSRTQRMSMICVFESTYPTLRMQTHAANYPPHPSNHDIIINYHAIIDHDESSLLQTPVFQPSEVDKACWLTPAQLEHVLSVPAIKDTNVDTIVAMTVPPAKSSTSSSTTTTATAAGEHKSSDTSSSPSSPNWYAEPMSYNELYGIYPNGGGHGIAEGGRVSAQQLLTNLHNKVPTASAVAAGVAKSS